MARLLTGLFIVFVFTAPANAATIHFTATTCHTCSQSTLPEVSIDFIMTVELTTGQFWNWPQRHAFTATLPTVTSLVGTVNGVEMILDPTPFPANPPFIPQLDMLRSYLDARGGLRLLQFTLNGTQHRIFSDEWMIFQGPGQLPVSPQSSIIADVVPVPDASSSLLLLAAVMAGLVGTQTRTRSNRIVPPSDR